MEKRKRPVQFTTGNKGTNGGCSSLLTHNGIFHQWGSEVWKCRESGFHTHTIGIIEDESGKVHQVDPKRIKFLDK